MSLLARNLTGSPVVLVAGSPPPTIPALAIFNVTSELRNSTGPEFAALEVQRPGVLVYSWSGNPEFATPGLTVTGAVPGAHGATHVPAGTDPIPGFGGGGGTFAGTTGEAIAAGALVSMDDSAGLSRIMRADADGAGEIRNPVGVATTAAGSGAPLTVSISGESSVPDALWIGGVPAVTNVGRRVYLSTTPGSWTLTAPSAPGDFVVRTGIVSVGGAGAVKVVLQIGEGVTI